MSDRTGRSVTVSEPLHITQYVHTVALQTIQCHKVKTITSTQHKYVWSCLPKLCIRLPTQGQFLENMWSPGHREQPSGMPLLLHPPIPFPHLPMYLLPASTPFTDVFSQSVSPFLASSPFLKKHLGQVQEKSAHGKQTSTHKKKSTRTMVLITCP